MYPKSRSSSEEIKIPIIKKNDRNYKYTWKNVGFTDAGPEDCEYEHPITGKCMSHYDYQVWINRILKNKK